MKIVYAENARIPSERAHAYQTIQWCYWMAKLGHDVTLVTPDRAEHQDVFEYYHLPERNFSHIVLPTFDALRYRWLPQSLAYLIQRTSFIWQLRKWAKPIRADIWYTRSLVMVEALLSQGISRWVVEVHDDPVTRIHRWRKTSSHVRLFVAISEGMKKCLMRAGIEEKRILVAHDGVDLSAIEAISGSGLRSQLGIGPSACLAVYTGSLYPWKGVDFLVEAWPSDPMLHLVIIGGPDQDRERIFAAVARQGCNTIHVLPTIPRQQAFSLLKEADIGLLPTSPDFSIGREYTSPLKLFEYLAAGLPILASDVPSSHEVLTASTAKFFPREPVIFADVLRAMHADKKWRAEASMAARKVAKQYAWQTRAERISEALATISIS
jgi:glycosyltransferase involved in cell wall biosynthesis